MKNHGSKDKDAMLLSLGLESVPLAWRSPISISKPQRGEVMGLGNDGEGLNVVNFADDSAKFGWTNFFPNCQVDEAGSILQGVGKIHCRVTGNMVSHENKCNV